MVGGTTFHWNVISREISRVLVLNLSGECGGGQTAWEKFVLDTAFPLIEGHPAEKEGQPSAPCGADNLVRALRLCHE